MKRIFLFFCACLLTLRFTLCAQVPESVTFAANNLEGDQAAMVNDYVSRLLTAFNEAVNKGTNPQLSDRSFITDEAWTNLQTSWKNNAFASPDPIVVESADQSIAHPGELEIRHIPLYLQGLPSDSWKAYQEATVRISIEKQKITSVNLSIDPVNYASVLSMANDVTEYAQLSVILDYLERLRNAYCIKDIEFLEQVYSDDALIITGTVIKSKKSEFRSQIKYTKYTKKEYISHLRRIFRNNDYIDVAFDSITVKRHPVVEGVFGVQLYQGYKSSLYEDEGYLFLLWDFRDPDHPQIHIRTWQDVRLWEENPDEERYDLELFTI